MNCKLIKWILGALGFSTVATSCEEAMVCMYGTPSAEYIFKVEVVDSETNTPIKGIQLDLDGYSNEYEYTSVTTAEDGKATLQLRAFPDDVHTLLAEDVDGAENGSYKSAKTIVSTDGDDYKNPGNNGWHKGTATHNVHIEMTPKTE